MFESSLKGIKSFFEENGELKQYKKGAIAFDSRSKSKDIYFIKKGYVGIFKSALEGKDILLSIYKSKQIFPLMWVLKRNIGDIYFSCLTDCEIYSVSGRNFKNFLKSDSKAALETVDLLSNLCLYYIYALETLSIPDVKRKVASRILFYGKRFGQNVGGRLVVYTPLTQELLAGSVALRRETVTRTLKTLQQENLIDYSRGKITILDPEGLKKLITS
ncbi:MAG: Crp/Fnr family transcriptional regulator [Patescibacteria group bacterium]|jgi:CRP-like cAMP-binding protein